MSSSKKSPGKRRRSSSNKDKKTKSPVPPSPPTPKGLMDTGIPPSPTIGIAKERNASFQAVGGRRMSGGRKRAQSKVKSGLKDKGKSPAAVPVDGVPGTFEDEDMEASARHYASLEVLTELEEEIEAMLLESMRLCDLNDFPNAKLVLKRALKKSPEDPFVYAELSLVHFFLGEYDAAEKTLLRAVAAEPDDHVMSFNLAKLYETMGRFDDAVRRYREVVKMQPTEVRAWSNMTGVLLRLEKFSDAAEAAENALQFSPDDATVLYNSSIAFDKLGDTKKRDDAEERLLSLEYVDPEVLEYLANIRALRADFEGAYDAYHAVVEMQDKLEEDSGNFEIDDEFLLTMHYVFTQLGRTSELIPRMESFLNQNEEGSKTFATHKVRFLLGQTLMTAGEYSEAQPHFEHLAEKDPTLGDVWIKLGVCHANQGRFPDAVKAFQAALEKMPHDADAMFNLALAKYRAGTSSVDEVTALFQESLDIRFSPGVIAMWMSAWAEKKAKFLSLKHLMPYIEKYAELAPKQNPEQFDKSTVYESFIAALNNVKKDKVGLEIAKDLYKRAPKDEDCLSAYANQAFHLKDFKTTKKLAEEWVKLQPSAYPAHFLLGQALIATNGSKPKVKAEAKTHYQAALDAAKAVSDDDMVAEITAKMSALG